MFLIVVELVLVLAGSTLADQGDTERVSDGNVVANTYSENPSISANGRYVACWSYPGIRVYDRDAGTTKLVCTCGQDGWNVSISADGRCVAFGSYASNLVLGDTNNQWDVFVHDRDPDGNGVFDEGNSVTGRVSGS